MPFGLLLTALVAVPRLAPGGVAETYRAILHAKSGGSYADGPYKGAPCGPDTEVEGCNFKAPDQNPVFATVHRKSALGVVDRWEQECRRNGGLATISPKDLMRLRRALL